MCKSFRKVLPGRSAAEVTASSSGAQSESRPQPRNPNFLPRQRHRFMMPPPLWRADPMRLPFLVVLAVALALLFTAQPLCAQNAFTPDQVKYGPAPAFVPPGAQLAVLEGNPMADSGDFTIRLKMPDGYKIAPHTHPLRENVTVISGTLKVGMGDQFDASKMMSFGSGSFAYLDPSMHHYAAASGETVIQIHGQSPVKFNYINPADDPSMKTSMKK